MCVEIILNTLKRNIMIACALFWHRVSMFLPLLYSVSHQLEKLGTLAPRGSSRLAYNHHTLVHAHTHMHMQDFLIFY